MAVRAAAVQAPVKIEKPLVVSVVTTQARVPMLRIIKIIRSLRISAVAAMLVIYRMAATARVATSRILVAKVMTNKRQESFNV